jgi:hypothetical protein
MGSQSTRIGSLRPSPSRHPPKGHGGPRQASLCRTPPSSISPAAPARGFPMSLQARRHTFVPPGSTNWNPPTSTMKLGLAAAVSGNSSVGVTATQLALAHVHAAGRRRRRQQQQQQQAHRLRGCLEVGTVATAVASADVMNERAASGAGVCCDASHRRHAPSWNQPAVIL